MNKVKSKNEFYSNNLKEKQKLYFNENSSICNSNNQENKNIKKIIYKKNNHLKNNLNTNNLKHEKDKEFEIDNYIKIEEINEILSSDTEDMNHKSPKSKKKIKYISESRNQFDEKEITSNNLTIKDEYNDCEYESNNDTHRDRNMLKSSMNFKNELALIPDKHLTQIDFNKNNYKNISEKNNSSQSPNPKQIVLDKNSQMINLNLNIIKDNPFQNNNNNSNNINNENELPINSAKTNKINKNKNIIRKSHHIMKEKKELILMNYLKQNFFAKNDDNSNSKNCGIHKIKNDTKNYEIIEEEKNKENKQNEINNIKEKNNKGNILDNEEIKLNIDFDKDIEEKKNIIKYKEYKIKNNSIVNGATFLDLDYENIGLNFTKSNDKLTQYPNLNNSLHKKEYNKGNNILNDNNYISYGEKGNIQKDMGFINKKEDKNNNQNGISLENEKNYEKKKPKKLYRNNSQNNEIKKKDSINSIDSIKDNENQKKIYQIKISNLNLNNLNPSKNMNANKINKEIKTNIKIESIEINNKLRKNIPSPQHRMKEKKNIIKKSKVSPINNINNNNFKLNSCNNLFNSANNTNSNINNNIENINNNIKTNNIIDKERIKSNSNNFIEYLMNKNNEFSLTGKEKTINEFINKDNQNMNKLSSKKNIKCINKNINPQKHKGTYKIKPKKSAINETINTNNVNNYVNPSTSASNNNNNSGINLEENYLSNNKSPKLSKNNINFNNSANKFIILNKNKRNIHNVNNNNNNEDVGNNSLYNYINNNSYSTADKNSFIHITNSNVTKMKNKMNSNTNNINNQKVINQNYMIHPKNLFSSSNNNIKKKINNNKNNPNNKKNDNISNNNSSNKLNNSNSNNNINDINKNNNKNSNLSKNINSDKKLNIYLYNNINIKNIDEVDKKSENKSSNKNQNPEIIKKSSTTMKNKPNNQDNNNILSNQNINANNRNSINGSQLSPLSNNKSDNIYNTKKIRNKKLSNKISSKVLKKNNHNNNYIANKTNKKISNYNEDTFIDGQIPTVADENPNVNSLKIMKCNKCAYTNQILIQRLTKIFSIEKIKNTILSFSSKNDLNNLSLVNSFYSEKAISLLQERLKIKILNNTETTIKILWNKILYNSKLYKNNNSFDEKFISYLNLSNRYDKEITKDLSRTLPNNIMFKKDSSNYKKLFNVLKAYSNYNKKIGYAQGMNFIVAKLIIFYKNEKDSFLNLDTLFTRLNYSEVVGISNGLEQKMLVIQFLLQKFCPKIINYFEQKKINHEMFTVSWVITLFSKNFDDNKLLLMIWCFSMIFGWKFIYLFTLSIIDNFQNNYLKLELYEFTQFMKQIFKSNDFKKEFNTIIDKTFEYMKYWKKINKELEKDLESYKMKADTESTEIIMDSFDEDTIIQ